jgi:flagellar hook-associated protein 3 FlgL
VTIRVNPNLYLESLTELSQTRQAEDTALEQVSTGLRVNNPSDDPSAAAANVGVQAQLANIDQYTTNVTSVSSQMQVANSTLSSAVNLLNQAITYGTQGGDSNLTQANRDTLATQIQSIQSELVSLANTTYQGQYLFAGTANTQPFQTNANGTVSYVGNDGTNSAEISPGTKVQTSLPGSQVFGTGTNNVFTALSQLSATLTSGGDVTTAMANLTSAYNNVSNQQVFYGNAVSNLENTQTYLNNDKVELSTQQNNLVGIDTATAVSNLEQAETTRQAALSAAGQIGQVSLLNYLPAPTA